MQLSLRNHSNDFLTIDKIRSSAFSTLRIKCHAMKVFFISFVNVKFITHFITMKLKQPKRLNVNCLSIKPEHRDIKGCKEIGMETPATL